MASLQKKGHSYYCQFLYKSRRHTVTIGKVSPAQADGFSARTEELRGLLSRGRVTLPAGVEIGAFVL